MIGGRFKLASVASIAAAGLFMGGVSAQAADLGGNCCADLEERVAELEATTARKGNRKVSLEVSGQVHEAIVFWDVNNKNNLNEESNVYIGTHNASRSRFRFKGSANINADWSAGFLMEIGVRANHLGNTTQNAPLTGLGNQPSTGRNAIGVSGLDIRHEALYVKSKSLGTVWLGWTSSAADGITEICLGCGIHNGPDYSDDMGDLFDGFGNRYDRFGGQHGAFVGEGDRREIIRYISPTIAGFVVSAAYGSDDFYDVALRYAGEFGAIRIAGGVAYQRDTDGSVNGNTGAGFISATACQYTTATSDKDCESIGASLSMQHVPTGIYVAGAYGQATDKNATGALKAWDQNTAWHATVGINQKWSSLGKTNIWAMYTQADREINQAAFGKADLTIYGVGLEQTIDAAAMTMFVFYKHFDADLKGDNTVGGTTDQIVAGALIKF